MSLAETKPTNAAQLSFLVEVGFTEAPEKVDAFAPRVPTEYEEEPCFPYPLTVRDCDLVVTTPQNRRDIAAAEAEACIKAGGGWYFKTFWPRPKELRVASRIFYVEGGFVRGFGLIKDIVEGKMICGTTGDVYGGVHAIFDATSWRWILPIPFRGFRGFKYPNNPNAKAILFTEVEVIAGWLDPKPTSEA